MEKKTGWFSFVVLVLATELIGVLVSLLSGNTGQIYTTLALPPLSPPPFLFGVVWPILYLLMAAAAFLIYRAPPSPQRTTAIRLYWLQLLLNFLWPIVFFRFEAYWLAAVLIAVLILLVAVTCIRFYRINQVAGLLLVPYLLWLLFAAYLNVGVALLST